MSDQSPTRSLDDIRAELAAAERAERDRMRELADAVQPTYRFTLVPYTARNDTFERVYDQSCSLWVMAGELTNADELRSVGKVVPTSGQMRYIFNSLSGRFVTSVSGGTIYVSSHEAWSELSEWALVNPTGGDVTEMVDRHRAIERKQRGY